MTHTVVPQRGAGRRRWWVLGGLLVIAALAVAAILATRDSGSASTASTPSARPSPSVSVTRVAVRAVDDFAGRGNATTTKFRAGLNWELRWRAPSGSDFAVELLNDKGASLGKVVTAGKKTSGSTFVSQAGSFKLKVTSTKPWTIQVFSRP